ncbi:hypothetical protein NG798_15710 [Ancylothrix sp. C2]|uniref:hypothetical protein n=1 Tax=Ancylothrix sp. D3o TaxID=2953691 RepID=UPI0021BB611E|nr:hypothetical protein [Ancylothrix sp. D3o]MCT7951246.1 hypothetical protein [Ancylothrix sp. D3o]
MKTLKVVIFLLILCLTLTVTLPAQANFCRQIKDQKICILTIKRSAKNHWEYRASVSINGKETPVEVYNCRKEIKIKQDNTIEFFEPNGAGELICTILEKR